MLCTPSVCCCCCAFLLFKEPTLELSLFMLDPTYSLKHQFGKLTVTAHRIIMMCRSSWFPQAQALFLSVPASSPSCLVSSCVPMCMPVGLIHTLCTMCTFEDVVNVCTVTPSLYFCLQDIPDIWNIRDLRVWLFSHRTDHTLHWASTETIKYK